MNDMYLLPNTFWSLLCEKTPQYPTRFSAKFFGTPDKLSHQIIVLPAHLFGTPLKCDF
jgi:hypothetical protein